MDDVVVNDPAGNGVALRSDNAVVIGDEYDGGVDDDDGDGDDSGDDSDDDYDDDDDCIKHWQQRRFLEESHET